MHHPTRSAFPKVPAIMLTAVCLLLTACDVRIPAESDTSATSAQKTEALTEPPTPLTLPDAEQTEEAFSCLMEGVYTDYMPGVYHAPVVLHLRSDCGTVYYKTSENDSYREWTDAVVLDAVIEDLNEYPCTTAVDGTLENLSGLWKSERYINNIEKTSAYVLFKKQPSLYIRFEGNDGSVCERVFSYIIDSDHVFDGLSVVSLRVSFDDMFGESGIYNDVLGNGKIWGTIEFFDASGCSFSAETSVKLGGNSTVGYPQRTLNLNFAHDAEGNPNALSSRHVFGTAPGTQRGLDNVTRFRLHNGGNTFESFTGFNDAFLQRLFSDTHVSVTAYRPAAAFINGEFWGLYMLREQWSDTFIRDHYDIRKDSVLIVHYDDHLDEPYVVDEGDVETALAEIRAFESFYMNHDLSDPDNFRLLEEQYLDVDSFIDFLIARSFSCDTDSIIKAANNKLWKSLTRNPDNPYADGRWHFGIHDADLAFTKSCPNLLDRDSEGSFCGYPLLDNLLRNGEFRGRLYARAEELLLTALSYERTSSVLNDMADEIRTIKEQHILRWGGGKEEYRAWEASIRELDKYLKTMPRTYLSSLKTALEKYGQNQI